ncbi:glycosyltransferase involved in cell wall biosynthesis [Methanococcus maripaludis]|uniref:Glycosyltransferase involved in cell wall biosynthesis n=1 Tax=Methanococcus maripaludis TaxID=39152 RepID=A0A7J9PLC3_METMI|nr:glycosyltransferase involved in cell wall biosynthesis [Methanococcus maripaludis]
MDGMNIHRFKYWFENEKNLADGAILSNLKSSKFFWVQVPFFLIFEFFSMAEVIKKYKIDIIHAHWIIPSGFLAVLYKKLLNKNIVVISTSHGSDVNGLKKFNFLKKWIIKNCKIITAVSNDLKYKIKNIANETCPPIHVIPMGVDTDLFNLDTCDKVITQKYGITGKFLLFVGRLSEEKGITYLIDAMPQILKEFSDTKLVIVGQGIEEKNLKKQASDLGLLDKNIIFVGSIPHCDLPKYYGTADVFIGPSIIDSDGKVEGFGLVFAEAISSGIITIATDVGGIGDIVLENKTGFIIKQKKSEEISRKVLDIFKNSEKIQKNQKNARNYIVENFDWKIVSKKYKKILHDSILSK